MRVVLTYFSILDYRVASSRCHASCDAYQRSRGRPHACRQRHAATRYAGGAPAQCSGRVYAGGGQGRVKEMRRLGAKRGEMRRAAEAEAIESSDDELSMREVSAAAAELRRASAARGLSAELQRVRRLWLGGAVTAGRRSRHRPALPRPAPPRTEQNRP